MMKKIFPLLVLMMLCFSTVAFAHEGTVVYYNAISKNTVLYSFHGYCCGRLESVDSGFDALYEGDVLDGHFGLGSHEFNDLTNGRKVTIRIEKMNLTKEDAKKWVAEKEKDGFVK